ncbi:MAG: M20/M25/M40 family metallo-hydrolase [Chloroflexota bacterium]
MELQRVYEYIERSLGDATDLLDRLCRQPSVSAQDLGVQEMAHLLADTFRSYGLSTQLVPTDGGPPLVFGEIKGHSDKALLLYNHYDVVPPEPLDAWQTPPFKPSCRNGMIFARGAADNKGEIVARLQAIRALQDVLGELPVTVKFVVEGEEESGSIHLAGGLRKSRGLLGAEACFFESGGIDVNGAPQLLLGTKGLLYVELRARTAAADTHSSTAPVVPNAAWRLVSALASLKAPDERVLVDGFYENVRPWDPEESEALSSIPHQDQETQLRKQLGISAFLGDVTGVEWITRLLSNPTCNICGINSGYVLQGVKTVLPATATAKLGFRLVPDQRPDEITHKLRVHLSAHGFADIDVHVLGSWPPYRLPVTHPVAQRVMSIATGFYGRPPVVYPIEAASCPMAIFSNELHIPVIATPGGLTYHGDNIHAPNENLRIADLIEASKFVATLIARFEAD